MSELVLVEQQITELARKIKRKLKQLPSLGFFVDLGSADFTKQAADMCCYLIERFLGFRIDDMRTFWDQGYLEEKAEYIRLRVQCIGKDIKAALSQNDLIEFWDNLECYTKSSTLRTILRNYINNNGYNGKPSLIDKIKGIFGLNNGKGSNGHSINDNVILKRLDRIENRLIVGESGAIGYLLPPNHSNNGNNRNQTNTNSNAPLGQNYGADHLALMDELKRTIKDRKCD